MQAGLSALELQRAELIRRNRERLESLGLPGLASEMLPEPKKAAKGAAHKGGWVGGWAGRHVLRRGR